MLRGGNSEAVYLNSVLRLVKPHAGNRRRAGRDKKIKKAKKPVAPKIKLTLPAVFVDASMKKLLIAQIAAVAIGEEGSPLYHVIEEIKVSGSSEAELKAIELGLEIRFNENWIVYCDYRSGAEMSDAPKVQWIPRDQNKAAHELAQENIDSWSRGA